MRIFFSEENAGSNMNEQLEIIFLRAAEECAREEKLPEDRCEICVSFVTPDEIRHLNKEYRGRDSVTDVLSFPQYEPAEIAELALGGVDCGNTSVSREDNPEDTDESETLTEGMMRSDIPLELGDVVICPEIACKQAEEYGHSFDREIVYLLVHSVMHLLGYDHMEEDEKRLMREKEERVMNRLGISR